jgi:hypothetical protein
VLGVVEVASLAPFGPRERALLDGVLPVAAMSLEILERRARTERLLDESEQKSARLAEQAEVLAAQGEELRRAKDVAEGRRAPRATSSPT